jgi:hypothetical protein
MPKIKTNGRNGKAARGSSTFAKKLAVTRRELRKTREERDAYQRALYARLKKESLEKREQYEEDMRHAVSEPPLDEFIDKLFD